MARRAYLLNQDPQRGLLFPLRNTKVFIQVMAIGGGVQSNTDPNRPGSCRASAPTNQRGLIVSAHDPDFLQALELTHPLTWHPTGFRYGSADRAAAGGAGVAGAFTHSPVERVATVQSPVRHQQRVTPSR